MNTKKNILVFFMVLAPLLLSAKFSFTTVSDVVDEVKKKYASFEGMSADFVIESEKGGKKTVRSGTLKSKFPNYLMVDFFSPAGQKIVSDGRVMWLYIPSLNVVAEQDLKDDESGIFSSNSRTGLQRLFKKYHYKFAQKEQPFIDADGKKYYLIDLQQKESRSGFKTMKIWIDEKYMITRAEGVTSAGKTVKIRFSKIDTSKDFQKGIFKMDKPASARVIKNPMLSEE